MSVTDNFRALGSWSLKLKTGTPRAILDALDYLGHVAISAGRDDPRVAGDSLLRSARYVGVLRGLSNADDAITLSGAGMAFWLGDEDNKGAVIENLVTLTSSTFTNAVRTLLPSSGAVTEGTLHSVTGTYSGTHQYQSPRQAIDYVCDTMGAAWRVNGDGTLDAGLQSDLFRATPTAAVIRKAMGTDMSLRALPGAAKLDEDVEDFTTRVVLLAQGSEASTATGSADILAGLNTYKDIHGNTVKLTRLVSESGTDQGNAAARAQVQLNRFTSPRDAVTVTSDTHDIRGDIEVGDYVWAFDPDAQLYDLNNQVVFQGQVLNPVKLQVTALVWPVEAGMGVAYRDKTGKWIDLTDYVVFEANTVQITVGGYNRSLTNSGTEPVGSRPQANTTIPDVPVFQTSQWVQSVYQSTNTGITKARVNLVWTQPLNTDGTTIIDGAFYEIRYRTSANPIFPATWSQVAGLTWSQMNTWDQPIAYAQGDWQYAQVSFDSVQFQIMELTPGIPYDFQVRCADNGTPANYSTWSATSEIQTNGDTIAPGTPAPPTVAGSRIALQITHTLGLSSGGTFNLDPDLNHLEVHAQYEPTFTPSDATRLGKVVANIGMLTGQIPVVATFNVESTAPLYVKVIAVDDAGNLSNASVAASATAALIDNQHISDLTVSKLTAGTMTADVLLAGSIKTATSGARLEEDINGLRLYNASGTQTVGLSAADGSATMTGTIQSGTTGQRVVVNPEPASLPRIDIYDDTTTDHTTMVMYGGNFLLQRETNAARAVNGGKALFQSGVAYFGFQNATVDTWMRFSDQSEIWAQGKWGAVALSGLSAVVVGWDDSGFAGPNNVTYSYGATMLDRSSPIVNTYSATANFSWCVSPASTGFTIRVSGGTGIGVHWWTFRSP